MTACIGRGFNACEHRLHSSREDGDPKNLLRMSDLTQVAAMLQLAPPPLEISLVLHA